MLAIPKPQLTKQQLHKFLNDPEVVLLEFLFILLTIFNVLILYRLLAHVIPYPISVTWLQLVVGFVISAVLGEAGAEFPKLAYFPRFTVSGDKLAELFGPNLAYVGMITLANVLLCAVPTVATYPVVISLGVCLHHVARFIGCGQIYLPVRWLSVGIMLLGFLMGVADPWTMGFSLFPLALLYALCAAVFRGWCLEKAMHVVEGRGNTLHNHQVIVGILVLPFIMLITGEWSFFLHMPYNFGNLYTWQTWGCLVTAGTLPFVKNIIANRLIRKTGQAPWRVLEVTSVAVVFILGVLVWGRVSIVGWIASILVSGGRLLGMLDVLAAEPQDHHTRRRSTRDEPIHSATLVLQETDNSAQEQLDAPAGEDASDSFGSSGYGDSQAYTNSNGSIPNEHSNGSAHLIPSDITTEGDTETNSDAAPLYHTVGQHQAARSSWWPLKKTQAPNSYEMYAPLEA